MLKVASCDRQGSIYIDERSVYRVVVATQSTAVMGIHNRIRGGVDGLISASVCESGVIPEEIDLEPGSLVLRHEKIDRISYPHEWCAVMLQDAAAFHLELCQRLLHYGLFVKDAHPWNILFERGQPVFVDYTSLVELEGLFSEEYLDSNKKYSEFAPSDRLKMIMFEIYSRMYKPYFINPLMCFAYGKRERVNQRIEDTTLNASTSTISRRECVSQLRFSRTVFLKVLSIVSVLRAELRIFSVLRSSATLESFYADMHRHVRRLKAGLGGSAYSAYYQKKGEDQELVYSNAWNDKQKSVRDALNLPEIGSVLDVACNTGWFALMAEKLGKSVVAFDIDEGCIEDLYKTVKDSRINVLPLVMDFTRLTRDRYSIHDGKKVLINAADRLRSDAVIALGIIHHLVLGQGMSFDDVLKSLTDLCKQRMVIEFIEPDDAMIRDEPSFFTEYFKNRSLIDGYSMSAFISRIEANGFIVSVHASYPHTRKILVCDRQKGTSIKCVVAKQYK